MNFKKILASIIIACIASTAIVAEAHDQNLDIQYSLAKVEAQAENKACLIAHQLDASCPETKIELYYSSIGFDVFHAKATAALPQDFTFPDIVIGRVETIRPVAYNSSTETVSLFQLDISNRYYSTAPPVLA